MQKMASILVVVISKYIPLTTLKNKNEFIQEVENRSGVLVIKFWAKWSGTCHMMFPAFEEFYNYYQQNALFYEVDVDDSPSLKNEFHVIELPTILIYKNGILLDYSVGITSKYVLFQKVEGVMNV